jgi:hypothetical protein
MSVDKAQLDHLNRLFALLEKIKQHKLGLDWQAQREVLDLEKNLKHIILEQKQYLNNLYVVK